MARNIDLPYDKYVEFLHKKSQFINHLIMAIEEIIDINKFDEKIKSSIMKTITSTINKYIFGDGEFVVCTKPNNITSQTKEMLSSYFKQGFSEKDFNPNKFIYANFDYDMVEVVSVQQEIINKYDDTAGCFVEKQLNKYLVNGYNRTGGYVAEFEQPEDDEKYR